MTFQIEYLFFMRVTLQQKKFLFLVVLHANAILLMSDVLKPLLLLSTFSPSAFLFNTIHKKTAKKTPTKQKII